MPRFMRCRDAVASALAEYNFPEHDPMYQDFADVACQAVAKHLRDADHWPVDDCIRAGLREAADRVAEGLPEEDDD